MSLTIHNLGLQIGAKCLLSNIDFTLFNNEVVAVLGPNGAGKSTLFKVLAGEYTHYTGEIELHGKNLKQWQRANIAQIMGVLPQSSELAFPFSVAEVVSLGRLPHSSGAQLDRKIVRQAMQQADISHLAQALYPSLSGGEKQRVQLARVLAQIWQPNEQGERFLLLDEPTSALDLAHQHQTLALARKMAGEGVGVLAILHDLNLAAKYADRIILLAQGESIAQGSAEQVLTAQQIEAIYAIPVTVVKHATHHYPMIVA